MVGSFCVLARPSTKKRTPFGRLLPQRRKTRDCRFAAKLRCKVNRADIFQRRTPLQLARPRDNSRNRAAHFNAKKRTPFGRPFFGAEDEIRTRATVSHTTPLAGEPLEPLGYFCNSSISSFLFKSYTTIPHFFSIVKAFCLENMKNFLFLFFPLPLPYYKSFLRKYSQILDGFFTIVYNGIVKKYFNMERTYYESNYHRKLR